jgi:hypothetical protein
MFFVTSGFYFDVSVQRKLILNNHSICLILAKKNEKINLVTLHFSWVIKLCAE